MSKIKHVSLDFWGTLATPNRHFADSRNYYLARVLRKPVPFITNLHTQTKRYLDNLAETNYTAYSVAQNYKILLAGFAEFNNPDCVQTIEDDINALFLLYPPTYNEQVVKNLANSKLPLSIGSNTNFISGKIISKTLPKQLKFKFKVFSDLVSVSKPSYKFFNLISKRAKCINNEILHIGDSETCDGTASQYGIQTIIINNQTELQTLTSLL